MNAADACLAGLADYRVAHGAKAQVIEALLQQPWGSAADSDSVLLQRLLQQVERSSVATVTFAPSVLREHFDLINLLCSAPTVPEIVAAIVAHQGGSPWLQRAAATLAAGAPASAWLALALQRRVRYMSLAEAFRLEFVVSLHCAARPDFAEGIRALIIEKDGKPQWQPAHLDEVTPAWLEGFFVDPWPTAQHPLADLGQLG